MSQPAASSTETNIPHRIFTYGTLSDTDDSGAPWTSKLTKGCNGTTGKIFGYKLYQHNIWNELENNPNFDVSSVIRYPFAIKTNNPNDYVIGRILTWPDDNLAKNKIDFMQKLAEFDKVNCCSSNKPENSCLFQRKIEKNIIMVDKSNEINSITVKKVSNNGQNGNGDVNDEKAEFGNQDEVGRDRKNNQNEKSVECVFYYRKYENINNWKRNVVEIPFGTWKYRNWYNYSKFNRLNQTAEKRLIPLMFEEMNQQINGLCKLNKQFINRNTINLKDGNNEKGKHKHKYKGKQQNSVTSNNNHLFDINSRKEALYLLNKLSGYENGISKLKQQLIELENNVTDFKLNIMNSNAMGVGTDCGGNGNNENNGNRKWFNVPNEKNWRKWDIKSVINWIMSLENGRYGKYCASLEYNFTNDDVTVDCIDSIDKQDLKQWGIDNFKDRCQLIKHFQRLIKIESNNSSNENDCKNDNNYEMDGTEGASFEGNEGSSSLTSTSDPANESAA